jgi:hypothetical protein
MSELADQADYLWTHEYVHPVFSSFPYLPLLQGTKGTPGISSNTTSRPRPGRAAVGRL